MGPSFFVRKLRCWFIVAEAVECFWTVLFPCSNMGLNTFPCSNMELKIIIDNVSGQKVKQFGKRPVFLKGHNRR